MGEVISAYNEMSLKQEALDVELRKAYDEMEDRVDKRTQELSTASAQLTTAIENRSEGFCVFDSEGRMVLCNTRYTELMNPGQTDILIPAITFKEILTAATSNGIIKDAKRQEENWITKFAQTINCLAEDLLTIINDILDFSRVKSGKTEMESTNFNIRHCANWNCWMAIRTHLRNWPTVPKIKA